MVTDPVPRLKARRADYELSDRTADVEVPSDGRLRAPARRLEAAIRAEDQKAVREAGEAFLAAAASFYQVSKPGLRVLAARPLRSREGWTMELFGDYHPLTKVIRVWMRTAVRKQVTSYGTLLSTLCHEFCHHLDYERYRWVGSPHTRGFYERTAALYHHARNTPRKRLVWRAYDAARWQIDWKRTRQGS